MVRCRPPQKLMSGEASVWNNVACIVVVSLCVFSFPQDFSLLQILRRKKKKVFVSPSLLPPSELGGNICLMLLLSRSSLYWRALALQCSLGPPFVPRSHVRTDYTPASSCSVFQTRFCYIWNSKRLQKVPPIAFDGV